MLKNFLSLILTLTITLSLASCSSEEPELKAKAKLLSFDIYEQTLDVLLQKVAERYDLKLNFNVEAGPDSYSLSTVNASVSDILKKLEADTGFYMTLSGGEILVEEDLIDENMTELTLQLNDNLWKDLKAAKDLRINEEVVKNFFGPLFTNVFVTNVNSHSKTIDLYLPKNDVRFIKKSLLYLNYLKQRRNLALTVFVVKNDLVQKFINGKADSNEAEFAWKLNAGDNIVFTDNKGNKVDISTQLLSQADNIAAAEVFIKLKFNEAASENNFNFSSKPVQSAPLSNKLTLIAKPVWYADNEEITAAKLNSKSLAKYQKNLDENTVKALLSTKTVSTGLNSLSKTMEIFSSKDFPIRLVSLSAGKSSDISAFTLELSKDKAVLRDILDNLPKGISYFADSDGVLIDCQGTIRSQRNIQWSIKPEKLDHSYYKFYQGAFFVEKEGLGSPVIYLPSANALVAYTNANILE